MNDRIPTGWRSAYWTQYTDGTYGRIDFTHDLRSTPEEAHADVQEALGMCSDNPRHIHSVVLYF